MTLKLQELPNGWLELTVPPGYAAFATVNAPEGYEEVSRVFDLPANTLEKVLFGKIEAEAEEEQ